MFARVIYAIRHLIKIAKIFELLKFSFEGKKAENKKRNQQRNKMNHLGGMIINDVIFNLFILEFQNCEVFAKNVQVFS